MRTWIVLLAFAAAVARPAGAEDLYSRVEKAMARSTLAQPGTQPFHLKAEIAPTETRDKDSGHTGTVEYWWAAPDKWRREIQSPAFRQVQIVNGTHVLQQNEGEYLPDWLRDAAEEVVTPVPHPEEVKEGLSRADVKQLIGVTHASWEMWSSADGHRIALYAECSLDSTTGLLRSASGFGWGGYFRDYQPFHDRDVARRVEARDVTARVVTLEDLGPVPEVLFQATTSGGEPGLLETIRLEESAVRQNLLPGPPPVWPELRDGPLQGAVSATIVVDRDGRVREVGTIVSDNPGVDEAARQALQATRFKPFTSEGHPVQVITRITFAFHSERPAGAQKLPVGHRPLAGHIDSVQRPSKIGKLLASETPA